MAPSDTDFRWTAGRLRAAELVAADELTDEEIARACHTSKRSLERWKRHPTFAARVAEAMAALAAAVRAEGIANRQNRIESYREDWEALTTIVRERGEAAAMAGVPGGRTGYLVHRVRTIGFGDAAREVDEYAFDAALLRARNELRKQLAIELGQWEERQAVSGQTLIRRVIGVSLDDL